MYSRLNCMQTTNVTLDSRIFNQIKENFTPPPNDVLNKFKDVTIINYNNCKQKQPNTDTQEYYNDKSKIEQNNSSGQCGLSEDGITNICGTNKKLQPLMDPRFNLREAAKNMILLEDHLSHEDRSCNDCILKHSLMIEAFLDEASGLDKDQKYVEVINKTAKDFMNVFKEMAKKINSKI